MGQARCLAAQNDKAAARDVLDRLIVARAGTPWEGMARDLQGVIDRFEGFKGRSIFDQMNAAAKTQPTEPGATGGNLLDALPTTPAVTNVAPGAAAVPATAK
jgi:hypothetical protein